MKKIRQNKSLIIKVCIATACFIASLCITIIIRDLVAHRNPDTAIPELRVKSMLEYLPAEYSVVGAYEWRFLHIVEKDSIPESEWLYEVPYGPVLPGSPMQLEYSFPTKNFSVSVSKDFGEWIPLERVRNEAQAGELAVSQNGHFLAPSEPGLYIYRIECSWDIWRGSVMYYLKLAISEAAV